MNKEQRLATILVLDDDPFFRDVVSTLLENAGMKVLEARTAKDASCVVLEQDPDLVIVDYRLPGIDGLTWIETMRKSGVKTPMIVLSGSAMDARKLNLMRNLLDVRLILRKPIAPDSFVDQITSLLPAGVQAQMKAAARAQEDKGEDVSCDSDDLSSEFDRLRAEYIAQLECEITDLKNLASDWMSSPQQPRANEIAQMMHRLRGTAGSYGLTEVGSLAGSLEDELRQSDSPPGPLTVLQRIAPLDEAVAQARQEYWEFAPEIVIFGDQKKYEPIARDLEQARIARATVVDNVKDAKVQLEKQSTDWLLIHYNDDAIDDILMLIACARSVPFTQVPVALIGEETANIPATERLYFGDMLVERNGAVAKNLSVREVLQRLSRMYIGRSARRSLDLQKDPLKIPICVRSQFEELTRQSAEVRNAKSCSIALFDVVNLDRWGFVKGAQSQDWQMSKIRTLFRTRFRIDDVRCQWSDNKFLISIADQEPELLRASAELFADELTYCCNPGGENQFPIRVEYGVSVWTPETDFQSALHEAFANLTVRCANQLRYA